MLLTPPSRFAVGKRNATNIYQKVAKQGHKGTLRHTQCHRRHGVTAEIQETILVSAGLAKGWWHAELHLRRAVLGPTFQSALPTLSVNPQILSGLNPYPLQNRKTVYTFPPSQVMAFALGQVNPHQSKWCCCARAKLICCCSVKVLEVNLKNSSKLRAQGARTETYECSKHNVWNTCSGKWASNNVRRPHAPKTLAKKWKMPWNLAQQRGNLKHSDISRLKGFKNAFKQMQFTVDNNW